MLAWINELTDLPQWQRKVFDSDFVFEWKSKKVLTEYDATRAMADYCMDEVRYYVQSNHHKNAVPAIDGGVIKSDESIDSIVKQGLLRAMDELKSDYRCQGLSAKGRQVADIVDPYLFPFAWDQTRTLRRGSIAPLDCITKCGEGTKVRAPAAEQCEEKEFLNYRNEKAWSNNYQWLPFDLTFDSWNNPRYVRLDACVKGPMLRPCAD